MRDREAERLAHDARSVLDRVVELIPRASRKLREWSAGGYPSGSGESSIGSDRHTDPVARAVAALAVTKRNDNGDEIHVGWRDVDPFNTRLVKIHRLLTELHKRARDLSAELDSIDHLFEGPTDPGCVLCDAVRLPVNTKTGKSEHECNAQCASADHRHPHGWQRIYNRKAPKPPVPELEPLEDRPRCSWHYDFAELYGEDAHPDIALYHLDHLGIRERVPISMIRTHHPDAFARRHNPRRTA